jgi:hypothetical protein
MSNIAAIGRPEDLASGHRLVIGMDDKKDEQGENA